MQKLIELHEPSPFLAVLLRRVDLSSRQRSAEALGVEMLFRTMVVFGNADCFVQLFNQISASNRPLFNAWRNNIA